jgi:hypothetical protein
MFAGRALVRVLAGVVMIAGTAAAIAGIAYAVNGATQARAFITIPVQVRSTEGLRIPLAPRVDADPKLYPLYQSTTDSGIRLDLPGPATGSWVEAGTGTVNLHSWGSTMAEQLAGRGGFAVAGVCVGLGALLLRTLLLSIAESRPFRAGNAARLAAIAGLIMVAAVSMEVFPHVGGELVLGRAGLGGEDGPVSALPALPLSLVVPVLIALVVLTLAEGFRRGAELARDVEGLV